jgi:hypothetical protein
VGRGARAEGDGEAEATSQVIWRGHGDGARCPDRSPLGVSYKTRHKKRAKRRAEAKRRSQRRAVDGFFKEHRRWKEANR